MRLSVVFDKRMIIMHLLFWVGYLSLSVFVFSGREDINRALWISTIQIIPQMVIAYINMEWLIPRYFIHRKYAEYLLLVLVCFFGLYLFYEFILPEVIKLVHAIPSDEPEKWIQRRRRPAPDRPFFNPIRRMRMIYSFTQTFAIFFLSTAFKTSQLALKREKEASELRSENLNSELKFLKSQINPHFLFNALNNIYSLSVIGSQKTPDNILKLSDMLRYIIYDCNADRVPLEKELNYIMNYIDLQKLKDDQLGSIETDFTNADDPCMIAPMIFIPFIGNAFKHSKVEDPSVGWIRMKIENIADSLFFEVVNSLPKKSMTKDKVGGVGLENVKRRLQLIYAGKHSLIIESGGDAFRVQLSVSLDTEKPTN
jgi:two-component system LytT family sensor kinase